MPFTSWSTNPASNASQGAIDWSEGQLPSTVNNSARQMMADLATWLATPTFPSGLSVTGTLTVNGVSVLPNSYMPIAGGVFTGAVSGPSFTASSTGTGRVGIAPGDSTRTGYISFQNTAGSQIGYIGNGLFAGAMVYDCAAGHSFSGGGLNVASLASAGVISQNGNAVWHVGNLNAAALNAIYGYTPYNSANPAGYITGINSGMVTTALGYTPYNSTNPAGYITGINSGNVTTALGYTPANKAGDTFTGTVAAPTVQLASGITVSASGGKAIITVGGSPVMSVDSSGNIRTLGNVTASAGSL